MLPMVINYELCSVSLYLKFLTHKSPCLPALWGLNLSLSIQIKEPRSPLYILWEIWPLPTFPRIPKDFSSVQSLSHVQFIVTPWIAAHQASLSITSSQCLLKLMSIKSVMPSKHLILCCPLLRLPSIFPSIRVFSSESVLHIRWPEYFPTKLGYGEGCTTL